MTDDGATYNAGWEMGRKQGLREAAAEIERLHRELQMSYPDHCAENDRLRAEIERLKESKVGWEVEGFIDRLTRRDDTNSKRLVLEAISHLRAFSRDCDTLREDNRELRATVERLRAEIALVSK